MENSRGIVAESVGNLLGVARAQKRSGMLKTEYSRGNRMEEGEIYVLSGQPIYARVGRLTGDEALAYLLRWRNIYFSFIVDMPRPRANLIPPSFPPLQTSTSVSGRLPTTDALRWNSLEEQSDVTADSGLPGLEALMPQKVGPERDALSLPLSRRQRLIYFLVDGRHSVGDLARCSNKSALEVELILSELQEQGLIAI